MAVTPRGYIVAPGAAPAAAIQMTPRAHLHTRRGRGHQGASVRAKGRDAPMPLAA
jgi:hypothetical protein